MEDAQSNLLFTQTYCKSECPKHHCQHRMLQFAMLSGEASFGLGGGGWRSGLGVHDITTSLSSSSLAQCTV